MVVIARRARVCCWYTRPRAEGVVQQQQLRCDSVCTMYIIGKSGAQPLVTRSSSGGGRRRRGATATCTARQTRPPALAILSVYTIPQTHASSARGPASRNRMQIPTGLSSSSHTRPWRFAWSQSYILFFLLIDLSPYNIFFVFFVFLLCFSAAIFAFDFSTSFFFFFWEIVRIYNHSYNIIIFLRDFFDYNIFWDLLYI